MAPFNVLLVDDDPDIAKLMIRKISREAPEYAIEFVESGKDCLEFLKQKDIDCILSDYQMPGMNGMELLRAIREMNEKVPFIFLTGQGNEEVAREAFMNGADDYFTKDISFAHFTRLINSIERGVMRKMAENERLAAEDRLRESEMRYRSLFESANDAIILMDGSTFTDCNSMALKVYGCESKGCLLGRTPMDFSPDNQPDGTSSRDAAFNYIGGALKGEPQRFNWRHERKDGTPFDVEVSLTSLDIDGKTYLQAIVRDITLQKKAEDALKASQNFLQTIIENEPECVKLLGPDGTLLMMNRAGLDMIQAETLDDVRGKPVFDLIAPEDREAFGNVGKKVFKGGTATLEFDMIGFKGRRLKLETRAVPLRDADDNIIALLGVTRDVTDQRRIEGELKEREERLRAILDMVNDAVFLHDVETGEITDVNQRMCEMYGYTRDEVIGMSVGDISSGVTPCTEADASAWLSRAAAAGQQRFCWDAKRKDGSIFRVEVSIRPVEIGDRKQLLATVHAMSNNPV